ncbi:MAG TPA: hypothetical protein ENJ10_06960 [Caldithrix abyssi]|uniref:Uncharacterized protein n=1 Tax=Caldithrix abyssi TaxID=187145 RepID=A0A7V1PUZ6_CALAY|nr:hypothetical protein [Caldithrix abyssi]
MKKLFMMLLLLLSIKPLTAQEYELGADLVSRYVWRGIELAKGASIQPAFSFSYGDFSAGTWASYALSPQAAGGDEHDFWASYSFGRFSVTMTDYYFPGGANNDIFDFSNNGQGAHVLEAAVAFNGGEAFPLGIFFAANVYNDLDKSLYLEVSWETASGVGFVAGFARGNSAWYAVSNPGLRAINIGVSYTKELKFYEGYGVPLSGQIIFNPSLKMSYFVVGLSL